MSALPQTRSGVLFCAGEGRRLRPLSLLRPKPLVPLHGIPLAEFGLRVLLKAGCDPIAVNGCHLARHLESWVKELRRRFPERTFLFFRESALLGTGGGLQAMLKELPPGPVLVHNGDVLQDWDPLSVLSGLRPEEILLLLTPGPEVLEWQQGQILSLREPARANAGFAGVHWIGEKARKTLMQPGPADLVERWQAGIAAEKPCHLRGVMHRGFWRDIGQVQDYLPAHRELWHNLAYRSFCSDLELAPDRDDKRGVTPSSAKLDPGSCDAVLWAESGWRGRIRHSILCSGVAGEGNLEGEILL